MLHGSSWQNTRLKILFGNSVQEFCLAHGDRLCTTSSHHGFWQYVAISGKSLIDSVPLRPEDSVVHRVSSIENQTSKSPSTAAVIICTAAAKTFCSSISMTCLALLDTNISFGHQDLVHSHGMPCPLQPEGHLHW